MAMLETHAHHPLCSHVSGENIPICQKLAVLQLQVFPCSICAENLHVTTSQGERFAQQSSLEEPCTGYIWYLLQRCVRSDLEL